MEKKLYRSKYGAFAGVCTGIAEYLGIESIIVQFIFVILLWTPVPIFLVYLFLWIFMKKEPELF